MLALARFAVFVACTAAVLAAAVRVSGRLYPERPWARLLAAAVLAITFVCVLEEVLGAVGLLAPLPVAAGALLGAAAVLLWVRPAPGRRPLRWPLATVATILLAVVGTSLLAMSLGRPTLGLDSLQYHYPMVAGWLARGDLVTPKGFGVGSFMWFYPSDTELLHTWTVVWVRGDYLISLVSFVLYGLSMAAVGGLVHRLGGRASTAVVAALAWATLPVLVGSQIRAAGSDVALAAYVGLAVYFSVAYWQGLQEGGEGPGGFWRRRRDVVLAGISLGLALGAKYTALYIAVALAAVFTGALVVRAARRRDTGPSPVGSDAEAPEPQGSGSGPSPRLAWSTVLGVLLTGAAGVALAGGFFYVRNAVVAGNPFYPVGILGLPDGYVTSGIRDILRFGDHKVIEYLLPPHPWLVKAWIGYAWAGAVLFAVGLVATPLLLAGDRRPQRALRLVVCGLVPALLCVLYLTTPTSAGGPKGYPYQIGSNVRYALPALLMGTVGAAVALDRLGGRWAAGLLGAVVVLDLGHSGLLAMGVGLGGGPLSGRTIAIGYMLGTAAVAAAALGVRLVRRLWDRLERPLPVLAAAVAVVSVLAGAVAARHYATQNRYAYSEELSEVAFNRARTWPEGTAVAYAGLDENYPLYGPRLANRVMLAAKEVDTGTYWFFDDAEELVGFMKRNRLRWLVVKDRDVDDLARRAGIPKSVVDASGARALEGKEARWARSRPDHFRVVAHEDDVWLFEFT